MSEVAVTALPVFKPMPGHNPRSQKDRYKRVHQYVSSMGASASQQLKQALLVLRNAAQQLPTDELRAAAGKQYAETEFLPAMKELLCLWIHLEAIDQGGESMPGWLMNYLQLALYSTDCLIADPPAEEIMQAHADCQDLEQLIKQVTQSMARRLGYGPVAPALAPAFGPLLQNSRLVRQKALKHSLTLDLAELT